MIRNPNLTHVGTIVISLLAIYVMFHWVFSKFYILEIALGWGVAYINHVVDCVIKRKSIQKSSQEFFKLAIGFNSIRLVTVLSIVLLVLTLTTLDKTAFVYALLLSYSIFMTHDLIHFFTSIK